MLLGPRRIFDSSVAHIAMLYASERGEFRPYHELAFERFFRRELDLGDAAAVAALLEEVGIDAREFPRYLAGPGRARHDALQRDAEAAGVFGVPSFLVEGELFWGAERLDRVRERIEQGSP
jgi:2-hydroxychromene-2-carboxylate isomerase